MAAQDTATGGKKLVIVESATKAKKIQRFLGDNYLVDASVGHIRDLPRGAANISPPSTRRSPGPVSGSTSTTTSSRCTW